MKTIKNVSIAVVAAMAFAACSSEGLENDALTTSNSTTILFDGYLGRSAVGSRAAITNLDALKQSGAGFAVFGQYSESGSSTFASNLFNNVHVTWGESAWTYSPLRYWPTEGSIDFYAVAPYSASKTLSEISDTDKDKLKLEYTVSSTVANQVDLLYAQATGKTKANNGSAKVQLTFNHALSKIGYSVKTKESYDKATINVTSIKLVGSEDGNTSAFYTNGSLNLKTGSWSGFASDKQNFTWLSTSTTINSAATNNADNDFLFVIPQDFSSSESLYVVVEYTVQTEGTSVALKNKVSQKLTKNFEQGKAYCINLSVGLTPIEFDASVTDWATAEGVDVTW